MFSKTEKTILNPSKIKDEFGLLYLNLLIYAIKVTKKSEIIEHYSMIIIFMK